MTPKLVYLPLPTTARYAEQVNDIQRVLGWKGNMLAELVARAIMNEKSPDDYPAYAEPPPVGRWDTDDVMEVRLDNALMKHLVDIGEINSPDKTGVLSTHDEEVYTANAEMLYGELDDILSRMQQDLDAFISRIPINRGHFLSVRYSTTQEVCLEVIDESAVPTGMAVGSGQGSDSAV